MMHDDMETLTPSLPSKTVHHQHSANVRRFARNTGAYQASFAKPARQHRLSEEESDEAEQHYPPQNQKRKISSDGEEDILINSDFTSYQTPNHCNYSYQNNSIEMQQIPQRAQRWSNSSHEISESTQERLQKQAQLQAMQEKQKWVKEREMDDLADRFKSTGVGFSPQQQLYQNYKESPKEQKIGSFQGWSRSPDAHFETGEQMRESEHQQQNQFTKYAMMYPQKSISNETWEQQNRNMGQPLPPSEQKQSQNQKKKKNKAPSDTHFLLTGCWSHHNENRSFFRNTGTYDPPQVENNKEGLIKWFSSLTLQDRVNCLTTTFPLFTNSIIDAQHRHVRQNGPLVIFQLKRDKSIDTQTEAQSGRRRNPQQDQDHVGVCILERVQGSDESQRYHQSYYSDPTSCRKFQTTMIKFSRIQQNKKEMDTLTISQELVKEPNDFFSLIENITDGKAFQSPISFCQKNGSKPLIQSPKWIESKKQNYLGVWIVAIIEETLWAHFNFATGFNIPSNCNKNELRNLFEARTLKLADPEDLAKRWTELGQEGQNKLISQLSSYAKDNPPSKFYSQYEDQMERRPQSHYGASSAAYNEDLYHNLSRQQDFGLYTFKELPVRQPDVYDRSDFYRTSTQYLDQQGMQTSLNSLANRSNNNFQLHTFSSHDQDLKDIIDIIQYLSSSIEVIKYLSEMPLQEINQKNYVRKHNLQAELHRMIQADLRQAIQEKLINECLEWDLNDEKKSDSNLNQQKDGKTKKKKSQQQEQRKQKQRQQTQQKQQYQKKKSVSKSPPKATPQKEKVLEKVQQQENTQKAKQTPEDPQKQPYSRVASTTTSDDQQPSVKPAQQPQQQPQRNQPKNKKKKQTQQESQEQIMKHVKAILGEIIDSVCQLELERQRQLQQEEVVTSGSESDQQILTPSQPDFSEKAEKEPQPGKFASLEQRVEPKPATAPAETQQSQKRRRKPKKKLNNIEEQLNNHMRTVCGDIPTTERQEYVPKKQGKDQRKQQQQAQNQKQNNQNQNQQKGQKQQPQGQKSQQQQQQQQQQPRRDKITPPIAENSGAEEPQPIPFIKHSYVGKPLPEPIGEKASTTRESLKKQQMSQSQTQELFSLESSKNAEPFIQIQSKLEPTSEVFSLEPVPAAEPLGEQKTVQISLSEHFGQQLKQENFLQEFKPLDTVFNQQQNQEPKKDTFTWVQPTIHVPQTDTLSTTSNAFTPFNPTQDTGENKQAKVEIGSAGAQEPLPTIAKFNSQTQMSMPQNYYYQQQQQHQQFQQEPLQKHYSQQYQRSTPQNQYIKQQKQGYQQRQFQQYQKSPPNNMGGQMQQNLFQIPQDQSSGSSGSFQARNTPKNQQFQQQPKNDFYSYQNFAYAQQNEQKVTPKIRIDAPAFQPVSENAAVSEEIFSPKEQKRPQQQWSNNNNNNFQFQPQSQPFQQPFYQQQEQVPMNQHPLFQRLEETFYQKFDSDIEAKSTKIQNTIDRFEEERKFVITKLQEMADKAFPNRGSVIKVFGSLMTGLALETSDMDIAVTGLRIDSRDDMVDDLHSLGDQVQNWNLIHDFKKHEKASIPVIKAILYMKEIQKAMGKEVTAENEELPIDISFDDSPSESQQLQMWHSNSQHATHEFGGFNQQPMQRMVSNDPMQQLQSLITGEFGFNFQNDMMSNGTLQSDFSGPPQPKCHLGLASCKLLKDYVKNYPHLKKVSVLLKHFLAVNNLNNAYLGGISSYSAVLLIVGYMNNFNLDQSPNLTPSRLLMGFLDFYSNCFDPSLYGVNTTNKRSFYQLQQVNQHNFIIQDPVNPTNNTARNSYRTPDILSHFRAAFFSLKSQITNQFQQQLAQQEALREQEMARARLVGDTAWAEKASNPLSPQSLSQGEKNQHFQKGAKQKSSADLQASSQEPALAKAQEQQQPSSNVASSSATFGAGLSFVPLAQAFDSINFVDCFLSADILKDGADKQAHVVEGLSYFQR